MHITASWEGVEEVVEVDEGCRSVAALLETVAAALPELDAEKVCLEIGGCAADDEAVCGLCGGSVVTVSVLPAVRAAATLREEGRRVNQKGFCCAADDGDLRVCRLFIEAGVAFESGSPCFTPLLNACAKGNIELCKLLIDGGHPLDGRDRWGSTPIRTAVRVNSVELYTLLIERGCQLDVASDMLHLAVLANSAELCTLLIGAGCCLDAKNGSKYTPLHLAVLANSAELCKLLIDAGCCLDVKNGSGDTPLHHAASAKSAELCKLLIDSGCALDVKNDLGRTPLHVVAFELSIEMCNLLVDAGCAVNVKNKDGRTPLDFVGKLPQRAAIRKVLLTGRYL